MAVHFGYVRVVSGVFERNDRDTAVRNGRADVRDKSAVFAVEFCGSFFEVLQVGFAEVEQDGVGTERRGAQVEGDGGIVHRKSAYASVVQLTLDRKRLLKLAKRDSGVFAAAEDDGSVLLCQRVQRGIFFNFVFKHFNSPLLCPDFLSRAEFLKYTARLIATITRLSTYAIST